MSDESNVLGQGSSIMLPPGGNPFRPGKATEDSGAEPQDASRFGEVGGLRARPTFEAEAGSPADLSPEDVAALFPSSAEDRNELPETASPHMAGRAYYDSSSPLLTSDQLASMSAQPEPPPGFAPPPRQSSARPGSPGGEIDLDTFDPDTPIDDRPAFMSRPEVTVDVGAFNPDLPVGETSFASTDTFVADASSIKADAPIMDAAPPAVESFSPSVEVAFRPAPASEPTASETASHPTTEVKIEGGIVHVDSVEVEAPRPIAEPKSDTIVPDDITSDIAEPGKDLPTLPAHSISLPLKEDPKLLHQLVTEDRLNILWKRIDETERRAIQDDSSLPVQRTANLENLRAARNIVLGGIEYYEDALRYVAEVEADLLYNRRVRKWSYTFGIAILLYQILWLFGLAYGYWRARDIATQFAGTVESQVGFAIWVTFLAGGLGGVSKALFSLYTHVTRQDFDRQYTLWYIASPIAGSVLGLFVYVFVQMSLAGISAAAQTSLGTITGATEAVSSITTGGFILYGMAWVVGFQQNLVLRLVDRVIKAILGSEEEKKSSAKDTSKPPIK